MTEPIRCRFTDCTDNALPNQSRCAKHQMRWLPRQSVERPQESPWVRAAREHRLPAKAL